MRRSNNIPFFIGMAYIALALVSLSISLSQRLINAISLGAVLLSVSELLNALNIQKVEKRSIIDVLNREECSDKYGVALLYIKEILKEKNSVLKRGTSVLSFLCIICNAFAFMCMLVYPHIRSLSLFDSSDRFGVFCTVISIGIIFISIAINNRKEWEGEMKDILELIDCFTHVTTEADKQVEKAVELAKTAIEAKNQYVPNVKKLVKYKGRRNRQGNAKRPGRENK